MCHAILKVSYHHDKSTDLIEVEKEEDFERRLKEVMDRPGVSKTTIFHPHVTHEEVKRWETRYHNTTQKEVGNEQEYQNDVPSLLPQLAEGKAQPRQAAQEQQEVCEGALPLDGEDCGQAEGTNPV